MREQIEALRKLQAQDHRVVLIERRLQEIPRRFAEMEQDVKRLEGLLSSEQHNLHESRQFKTRLEMQNREDEDRLAANKSRASQIKNSRELNANQREVDGARRSISHRVEEIANLEKAIAAAEERVAHVEKSIAELREQLVLEREKLVAEQEELAPAIAKHLAARGILSQRVNASTLAAYERVHSRAGGIAFVPVREQRCAACKIMVPHRVYVGLKNADVIPACDGCGRLLYWAGLYSQQYANVTGDSAGKSASSSDSPAKSSSSRAAGPAAPRKKAAPRPAGAATKKRGSRGTDGMPTRPLQAPKPLPEKVINDPMALDDDDDQGTPVLSAPRPAPSKSAGGTDSAE